MYKYNGNSKMFDIFKGYLKTNELAKAERLLDLGFEVPCRHSFVTPTKHSDLVRDFLRRRCEPTYWVVMWHSENTGNTSFYLSMREVEWWA